MIQSTKNACKFTSKFLSKSQLKHLKQFRVEHKIDLSKRNNFPHSSDETPSIFHMKLQFLSIIHQPFMYKGLKIKLFYTLKHLSLFLFEKHDNVENNYQEKVFYYLKVIQYSQFLLLGAFWTLILKPIISGFIKDVISALKKQKVCQMG